MQWVKDSLLLQQWHRSQLWLEFDPWLRNFPPYAIRGGWKKKRCKLNGSNNTKDEAMMISEKRWRIEMAYTIKIKILLI